MGARFTYDEGKLPQLLSMDQVEIGLEGQVLNDVCCDATTN